MATKFIVGAELGETIRQILSEDRVRAAVAFWGSGCETWVSGKDARIIANLTMGGTNPRALRKVTGHLRQFDRLHAKVYIGAEYAIVASANASINGLAVEGTEVSGWVEAGVRIEDVGALEKWFEDLWLQAVEVSPEDWDKAERAWDLRSLSKPPLRSFAEFDVTKHDLPTISWFVDEEGESNEEALIAAFSYVNDGNKDRLNSGTCIRNLRDAKVIANKWMLCWHPSARGNSLRGKPWFEFLSDVVVVDGYRFANGGELRDVVLAAETSPPAPFDPTDPRFIAAMKKVLPRPEYAELHEDDRPGAVWFEPRQNITRQFWLALKDAYVTAI